MNVKDYQPGLNASSQCLKCKKNKLFSFQFGIFEITSIGSECICDVCSENCSVDKIVFKDCKYSYLLITHPDFNKVRKQGEARGLAEFDTGIKFKKITFDVKKILGKYEIERKEIKIGKYIGGGAFGKVYAGKWNGRGGGIDVAIKSIELDGNQMNSNATLEIFKEFQIISEMNFPLIARVYGYSLSKKVHQTQILIVMDMYEGDIYNLVSSNKNLTLYEKFIIMKKMTQGINFLHKSSVIHRDIKSFNFLYKDAGKQIAVTDFGLATTISKSKTHIEDNCKGTLRWMAPELFVLTPKYTKNSDVYALGISFWEIIFEKIPYHGASCSEPMLLQLIQNKGVRPTVADKNIPNSLKTLLVNMWDKNPKKRPSCEEILLWFEQNEMKFKKNYNKVMRFDA